MGKMPPPPHSDLLPRAAVTTPYIVGKGCWEGGKFMAVAGALGAIEGMGFILL